MPKSWGLVLGFWCVWENMGGKIVDFVSIFSQQKGTFFFGSSYFKYRGGGGTPKNMMIYTNYYMFLWLLYVFYLYVFVVREICKKT